MKRVRGEGGSKLYDHSGTFRNPSAQADGIAARKLTAVSGRYRACA